MSRWTIDFGNRPWHRWFAWYPVQLSEGHGDTRVWLEWVDRKIETVQGYLIARYRLHDPTRVHADDHRA